MSGEPSRWGSRIAHSTPDAITVRGHDLVSELIGRVSVADLLALEVKGTLPSPGERAMVDAFLVALAEHGPTPSTLAARLTMLGSPEALQAAVAAGLLGAGGRFLGTMEGAARLLQETADEVGADDPRALAARAFERLDGAPVPGLGHPVHKPEDPRSVRLFGLAEELGVAGPHAAAMRALRDLVEERTGRHLPINVTGAIGAIASDLGYPWAIVRGFGLVARCVGVLGHLAEELEHPVAAEIWAAAEGR